MKEKKLKQSPIVLALYVLGALMLVYAIYQIISTCVAISSYYSQMGSAPKATEIISYILQAVVQPISTAAVLGAAGYILNEVRALNPNNYEVVEKPAPKTVEAKAEGETSTVKETVATAKKATTTAKKPAAKKTTTTAKKPAAKKATTTAKKPAAKKTTTTAKKPAAKKATTTKKPAAKKTEDK